MKTIALAATALTAALLASGAGAATLSLDGGGYASHMLSNYDLTPDLDGETISYLDGNVKNGTNGLALSGPAKVTFTYGGSEAGNVNYSAKVGGGFNFSQSTAIGTSVTMTVGSGGLLDFHFGTMAPLSAFGTIYNQGVANPNNPNYAIGYFQSGSSWYALFDDLANGDKDFDDFVLKIDVAPVPIPAAGFLLLGGLGIMGAVARRRKAA